MPPLNQGLREEKGHCPAEPRGKFELFGGLVIRRIMNRRRMKQIDEDTKEYKGRRDNVAANHPVSVLIDVPTSNCEIPAARRYRPRGSQAQQARSKDPIRADLVGNQIGSSSEANHNRTQIGFPEPAVYVESASS